MAYSSSEVFKPRSYNIVLEVFSNDKTKFDELKKFITAHFNGNNIEKILFSENPNVSNKSFMSFTILTFLLLKELKEELKVLTCNIQKTLHIKCVPKSSGFIVDNGCIYTVMEHTKTPLDDDYLKN